MEYIEFMEDRAKVVIIQSYEWLFECDLHGFMPSTGTTNYRRAIERALFVTSQWKDLSLYNFILKNYK